MVRKENEGKGKEKKSWNWVLRNESKNNAP
jgi:hypothetical protein